MFVCSCTAVIGLDSFAETLQACSVHGGCVAEMLLLTVVLMPLLTWSLPLIIINKYDDVTFLCPQEGGGGEREREKEGAQDKKLPFICGYSLHVVNCSKMLVYQL